MAILTLLIFIGIISDFEELDGTIRIRNKHSLSISLASDKTRSHI